MTATHQAGADTAVPPRERWPEPDLQTDAGRALTEVVLTTFRLNGRLLEAAQLMVAEGGLTAAWWQVIGGVLDQPRTVAGIARRMGMPDRASSASQISSSIAAWPSTASTRPTGA